MNEFEDLKRRAAADNMTRAEMSEAIRMLCDRLTSTTCPGHGRSECVSCCWPKGEVIITVVKPDGKGPHELRIEAECRVKELANLLTLARPHVPVTDPLRGLINANLMQHLVKQEPKS